jgi:hypothetical protein
MQQECCNEAWQNLACIVGQWLAWQCYGGHMPHVSMPYGNAAFVWCCSAVISEQAAHLVAADHLRLRDIVTV